MHKNKKHYIMRMTLTKLEKQALKLNGSIEIERTLGISVPKGSIMV